ncbi:MAG: HAMP domain-containing histidine kinase [Planctomycetales bacterium]|nr:HAMP domain-containing histidine kinase [Planctomycetales bacterium]
MNAAWLMRLRWVAASGQLVTIAVAVAMGVALPLLELLAIVGVTVATNAMFHWWIRRGESLENEHPDGETILAAVMLLDLSSLTGLLAFTGGLSNPFALFYLVNVALAAMLLSDFWSWTLTVVAAGCFALLFKWHRELPDLQRPLPIGAVGEQNLASFGRVVALLTCSGVIVYFLTRVTHELRMREAQLRAAEQQRARAERLEALATLAAGAGHELATPLSTIAVVAKELSRHLEGQSVPQSVLDDVALIRQELDQCRIILDRLAGSAGQSVAEADVRLCVTDLLDEILEGVRRRARVTTVISNPQDAETLVRLPLQSVAQAIRGVVRNALDASPPDRFVKLSAVIDLHGSSIRQKEYWLRLAISDQGSGMDNVTISRATEPFFTTKEPGRGMGLGLFLTKSVVDRLGGRLSIESQLNHGTTVQIELPIDSVD